jgi:tetratricopeptide (TPR) repeat protein
MHVFPTPPPPEKTVFISYRDTNLYTALTMQFQLRRAGFDVLLNLPDWLNGGAARKVLAEATNSKTIEEVIAEAPEAIEDGAEVSSEHTIEPPVPAKVQTVLLEQIASRMHFILLLTPSALERSMSLDDPLRQQVEHAIHTKRNIVPLIFDGFEFNRLRHYLNGKLALLPNYQWLRVNVDYLEETIGRLTQRYLLPPLDMISGSENIEEPTRLPWQRQTQTFEIPSPIFYMAERHFESGFLKLDDIDYEGAIAEFTEAISLNLHFAEAYYQRGRAFAGQGKIPQAIVDWKNALDLEPDNPRSKIILASILRERREYVKALAAAQEGVRLNPGYYEAYYQRGNIFSQRQKPEKAIEDYTEAIRLNPKFAMAYTNRGNIRQMMDDYEGAIADYNEALRLNPRTANVYNNRGYARAELGDLDGALDDFDEAIRLLPEYQYAYYNRAEILEKKGDLKSLREALKDYQRYLGFGDRDGDREEVEELMRKLREKINQLTT